MKSLGAWKGVILIGIAHAILGVACPGLALQVFKVSRVYLVEMAIIIPAVVLLMGLFEVWVSREMIERFLGKRSGLKGMFLAFLMGTAPTGPLYVAFPLASSLLRKGANHSNIIVFLGAWAAAKVPQIALEAKLLGLDFATVRLFLTALSLGAMGYLGEVILLGAGKRQSLDEEGF